MSQDSKVRYYRVSPKVWRHAKKSGWGDRETLLALYLLTCPHRNMSGLYYLPREYMQADLGWSRSELSQTLHALSDDGFVQYDDCAQVALITNALAYDSPENPNQIKATMKQLEEVPDTPLLAKLAAAAAASCKPLADAIISRWPHVCVNPSPNPSGNGSGNGSPNPLQELFSEPLAEQQPQPFAQQQPQPLGKPVSVSVTVSETNPAPEGGRVRARETPSTDPRTVPDGPLDPPKGGRDIGSKTNRETVRKNPGMSDPETRATVTALDQALTEAGITARVGRWYPTACRVVYDMVRKGQTTHAELARVWPWCLEPEHRPYREGHLTDARFIAKAVSAWQGRPPPASKRAAADPTTQRYKRLN